MRTLVATLTMVLLAASTLTCSAQDAELRWRTSVDGKQASLFAAESDATDSYGPISFSCTVGSGQIGVSVQLHDSELKSFSRVIADNIYPAITFPKVDSQPSSFLLERISFGEMGGWELFLTLESSHKSLENLEKTGSIEIAIGKVFKTDADLKAGLDAIKAFRRECRKPASTPNQTRKNP